MFWGVLFHLHYGKNWPFFFFNEQCAIHFSYIYCCTLSSPFSVLWRTTNYPLQQPSLTPKTPFLNVSHYRKNNRPYYGLHFFFLFLPTLYLKLFTWNILWTTPCKLEAAIKTITYYNGCIHTNQWFALQTELLLKLLLQKTNQKHLTSQNEVFNGDIHLCNIIKCMQMWIILIYAKHPPTQIY